MPRRGEVLIQGIRRVDGLISGCGVSSSVLEYDLRSSRMFLQAESAQQGRRREAGKAEIRTGRKSVTS
jgi:hypothetical protein